MSFTIAPRNYLVNDKLLISALFIKLYDLTQPQTSRSEQPEKIIE
jgi:hypothetical protein